MIRTEMLEVMRGNYRNSMLNEKLLSHPHEAWLTRICIWWKEIREKDRKRTWTLDTL